VLTLLDLKSKVLGTILEPFSSCKLSRTIPLCAWWPSWMGFAQQAYHPMTSSDVSPRLVPPGTIVWLLRNRLGWRCWTSRVTRENSVDCSIATVFFRLASGMARAKRKCTARWADLTTEWSPFQVKIGAWGLIYGKKQCKKHTFKLLSHTILFYPELNEIWGWLGGPLISLMG
jgi:hypothetical protein